MIQYSQRKSLAPKVVHADTVAIPGQDDPSYAMYNENWGWWNFNTASKTLRTNPGTVVTREIVYKNTVTTIWQFSEKYEASTVGILQENIPF